MSAATRADVYRLIGFIENDLRAVNAKFTELRSMLAQGAMNLDDASKVRCRVCGAELMNERALAFHNQNVHNGPPVPLSPEEEAA